jgi:hypothetical protein
LLDGNHLLDRFDCRKPVLNQGLFRDARKNQSGGSSRTWVVAVSDMESEVRSVMRRAQKVEEKQLKADQEEIEADAAEAQKSWTLHTPCGDTRVMTHIASAQRGGFGGQCSYRRAKQRHRITCPDHPRDAGRVR